MSKKSRKRNKKILAAIGIGLGAAALASKKKANATETNNPVGGVDQIAADSKKDTAVKTKTTIQDNKPKDTAPKKVRMTSANVQSGKIDPPYKGFNFGDGVEKRRAEEANFNAKIRKKNNPAVTGTTLPGMKSGGRANYKSGGSAKGCGKALRGFGKAMKGKR